MSDSENTPIEPNPASAGDAQVPDLAAANLTPPAEVEEQQSAAVDEDRIPVPDDGLGEWPTHGGPLGCLVGLTFGFLLAGFLGSTLISFVHFSKAGAGGWYIFSAVLVMLVFSILFAALGWRIGKRIYREYAPTPRQVRIAEQIRNAQAKGQQPHVQQKQVTEPNA